MNDNSERFADLRALSNLFIEGSVFQHKRIIRQLGHHLTCQQGTMYA